MKILFYAWMIYLLRVQCLGSLPFETRELGLQYFSTFLDEIKVKSFPDCTERYISFGNGDNEDQEDTSIVHEYFKIRFADQIKGETPPTKELFFFKNNTGLESVKMFDAMLVSRCPVYISISKDISQLESLFEMEDKDWDKYFFSRKHLIYTESPIQQIQAFFNISIMNTLINLVVCRFDKSKDYLQVMSNKPYDLKALDPIQHLTTHRGGESTRKLDYIFWDKMSNFHQYEMDVVTFHFPPRIFMVRNPETGENELRGLDISLVETVAEVLNIRLNFRNPSDGELWGWETENGTWTGLMGDLQYHRAHIGVADIYVMEPYFKIIDMSVEYDMEYLCFVNPIPGPLPQWYGLVLPFAWDTWYTILAFVCLGMVIFVALATLGRYTNIQQESKWFESTSNNVLVVFSGVVSTIWIREPASNHLRIFLGIWSISFFILGFAYKGSLVSHLTIPRSQLPIDTHEDLYKKGVPVGSIGNTFQRIMEKNADPWIRKLADRYQVISSVDEGFQQTATGSFSLLESRGFLEYKIAIQHTDSLGRKTLHVMREYIAPFGVGAALPKYVPYKSKFDGIIRRVTEAGLPKKWISDIILRAKEEKRTRGTQEGESGPQEAEAGNVKGLGIGDLQGAFYLLVIGHLVAALCLAAEASFGGTRRRPLA